MRSSLGGFAFVMLTACGVFGTTDDPDNTAPPEAPAVGGPAPAGVYVSSSKGSDDGSGSVERPIKTLKAGFAAAKAQGVPVIVCSEQYEEAVVLFDGMTAYGYFDCGVTPWARIARHAIVRSPSSPAVSAKGLTARAHLEGFDFIAPDLDHAPATDAAGTSIALEVRDTRDLTILDSTLHAGKGAPGTDGKQGPVNSHTTASDGMNATDQGPGVCGASCTFRAVHGANGGVTTCAIGPSGGPGGRGGDGQWYDNGAPAGVNGDYRGLPFVATAATGVGALNENAAGTGHGLAAARAADGVEGKDGVNGTWLLTAVGFARGNGTAGTAGGPGQGGGGGAGSRSYFSPTGGAGSSPIGGANPEYYQSATGGGGGGGGCGGQPGSPGTGGGASIGALVVQSGVTFERVRIEASAGGRAGMGNLGTPGIEGGKGGQGTTHTVATTGKGGDGGTGGSGGASGHGAPGPSIALAYDRKPVLTQVDLLPGEAGAGQPELRRIAGGSVGTKTLPSSATTSEKEYEIKH